MGLKKMKKLEFMWDFVQFGIIKKIYFMVVTLNLLQVISQDVFLDSHVILPPFRGYLKILDAIGSW
jgi:hypothetical protein